MTAYEAYVVDAHALVWDFLQDRQLSSAARQLLRSAEQGEITLVIPTIVLAEVQRLSERRRRDVSTEAILRKYASLENVIIAPFDLDTFEEKKCLSDS